MLNLLKLITVVLQERLFLENTSKKYLAIKGHDVYS
jgi:hypothetical protein